MGIYLVCTRIEYPLFRVLSIINYDVRGETTWFFNKILSRYFFFLPGSAKKLT